MRVNDAANIGVYDAGFLGDEQPTEMMPLGSKPSHRWTTDLYVLNPGRVCNIRLRDSGVIIYRISFIYDPPSATYNINVYKS